MNVSLSVISNKYIDKSKILICSTSQIGFHISKPSIDQKKETKLIMKAKLREQINEYSILIPDRKSTIRNRINFVFK
jgi:hypothetical protein